MTSTESIDRLRAQFEQELTAHPAAYHSIDIERVRTEEWQVKRFLIEKDGDEGKAFEALVKTLQWKQSFGLHERTAQYFPKEMYVLSGSETAGTDRQGRLAGWGTAKNHRPLKEMSLLKRQFVAHQFETIDRMAGEAGCVTVTDANGTSMFNVDNEMQKFQTELFTYYPQVFRAMYLVDMPWVMNTITKLFLSWMDPKMAKLVILIKAEQLSEFIDPEHIPVTLKGGRRRGQNLPDNLLPMTKRYVELGLDDKFVDHYYKTFKIDRSQV